MLILFIIMLSGCTTIQVLDENDITKQQNESTLRLTFAGDIMGHINVTRMNDYSLIYKDILDIIQNDDLTFANLETPVCNDQDYENYPTFNVKNEYPQEAINSGFQVFSLANNHTNDQDLDGIKKTLNYFSSIKNQEVYFAGLKKDSKAPLTFSIIEKNGFKILFMAITEIVNQNTYLSWFDYVSSSEKSRKEFLKTIHKMKKENSPDIFILSVHCDDPEYIRTVTNKRKKFYNDLVNSGVDIVWANHPHVTQEWEQIKSIKNPSQSKYIMYSLGNTISGQRYRRNYKLPDDAREYTGDSVLLQIEYIKKGNQIFSTEIKPTIITTHTDNLGNSYIKKLNETFFNNLSTLDKNYYQKRLELMQSIKGNIIWQ